MLRRSFFVFVLVVLLTVTSFPGPGVGTVVHAQSPTDGESVFNANCVACHSTGTDTTVGPGLSGLFDRAGSSVPGQSADDYVRESIADPGAFVVEGFQAIMPTTFAASLSSGDLDDLVAYLGTLSAGGAVPPEPELISAEVTEGDRERGENLFTGPSRFENRGPSCSACHSSSGLGALGGGSLGPDLTGAYGKLGDAMILWPETVAPMSPIFTERPLTDQEKADLLAFFKSADVTSRDTAQVLRLFGLALIGLVIIAVATHLIWRRRLRGVRKPMVGTNSLTAGPRGNILKRLLTGLLWEQSGPQR